MTTFKKFNYILNGRQKINLVILFFMILFGTFMELIGVSVILPFVQAIVSPDTIMNNQYVKIICDVIKVYDVHSFLLVASVTMIFVYIFKNAYVCFMNSIVYRFIFNNQKRLAYRMFDCYLKQPYLFHVSKNSSELIRTISGDTTMFFSTVLSYLQLFTEFSVCIILIVFLAMIDKSITFGVAFVLVLFVFIYIKIIKKKIALMGEATRKDQISMTKWIQQAFGGIKEVKLLGRERFFLKNYDKSFSDFSEASRKFQVYSFMPKPLMEALCVSGLMAVISVKLYRGVDLSYFAPTLSVFAIAAFRMLPSAGRIAQYINGVSYNQVAVDSVYNSLKDIDDLMKNGDIGHVGRTKFDFSEGIHIDHMSFQYPNIHKYVLDDVSLDIPKNLSVAFVGPSGAGKTTLADIILGMLKPEKGAVLADDINIHENLIGWNKHLGYIPQSIFLTDDTLRNNIAFGLEDEQIDDERIWKVLEDAQLKTFVEQLPNGLDTSVGERGARLSGGQRQRIGIARALYTNPDVLVLDEATSALDNETETAVMEAIENLSGKKTIIIIAHRLTTIRNCDIVYEVNEGKVTMQQKKDKSREDA